ALLRPTPTSTSFPYTTLFRSNKKFSTAASSSLFKTMPSSTTAATPSSNEPDEPSSRFWDQAAEPAARHAAARSHAANGFAILGLDRKSTRLNSSHVKISYAVF